MVVAYCAGEADAGSVALYWSVLLAKSGDPAQHDDTTNGAGGANVDGASDSVWDASILDAERGTLGLVSLERTFQRVIVVPSRHFAKFQTSSYDPCKLLKCREISKTRRADG